MSMAIFAILFWIVVFALGFWFLIHIGRKKPKRPLEHTAINRPEKDTLEEDSTENSQGDGLMSLDDGEEMFPEE